MTGISYDPFSRRIRALRDGRPEPGWALITHNLQAAPHQCRRIMREWLSSEELGAIDFGAI